MSKYILSDIFKGDFPISQGYGSNPVYYAQFGLKGHEGVDWATPTGTEILAPFDGVIVRDNDDPRQGAYGDLLVVWDQKQNCAVWFCHLNENYFSIGDVVNKGQVLGKTGNSGNTTGPHLHFNFVETDSNGVRKNLDNGYKGFLNALDTTLVQWKLGDNPTVPFPQVPAAQDDNFIVHLGGNAGDMKIIEIRNTLEAYKNKISDQDNKINNAKAALG